MTTTDLADIIKRQLAQHGYEITEAAARDAAAQVVMCMECAPWCVACRNERASNPTDTSGTWSPAQANQRTT